jgi:hypothetical protein
MVNFGFRAGVHDQGIVHQLRAHIGTGANQQPDHTKMAAGRSLEHSELSASRTAPNIGVGFEEHPYDVFVTPLRGSN